jgi:DNA-binding NarL/FixJ family response regulator
VARQDPDVLVVSLDLPGTAPGNVVAIARDRWPRLAIVALSAHPDDEAVLAALELGASAHVPRSAEPDHIVTAVVQAAASPGAFLAEDLGASRRRARASAPGLTPREFDVLRLAAEGLTVAGISARLYVSQATTRSHLSGIYRKLGVTNRSQAVLAAERQGLLR